MSEPILIVAMTIAFAVTSGFMFALRPVARSLNLVDRPGGRKSHVGIVPIIGGISMFLGFFSGISLVALEGGVANDLFIACALLVTIGVLDDRYHVPAGVRMLIQLGSILIMIYGADLVLRSLGDPFGIGEIGLGPLSIIMTVLVTLTVVNAYNLVDGVDGLAGTLALIALLSLTLVGGIGTGSTLIAMTLVATIGGFLLFNFPSPWNRAVRAFMGDAGSTFLGFMIVWVTLGLSQGPAAAISPVYCLWFAAIPIFDLFTCVVRRSMSGKSPFMPGRDHFHHTLKRGGMGTRQVLGILTGMQLVYSAIALAAFTAEVSELTMFIGWVFLAATQRWIICSIRRQHRIWMLKRRKARTPAV